MILKDDILILIFINLYFNAFVINYYNQRLLLLESFEHFRTLFTNKV